MSGLKSLGILLSQPKCCPKSPRNTRWCIVSKHSAKKTSISYALDTSGASKVAFFFSAQEVRTYFFQVTVAGREPNWHNFLSFNYLRGCFFFWITCDYSLGIISYHFLVGIKHWNHPFVCLLYTFKTSDTVVFSESNLEAWVLPTLEPPGRPTKIANHHVILLELVFAWKQQQLHSLKLTAKAPENGRRLEKEVCYWKPAFLGAKC